MNRKRKLILISLHVVFVICVLYFLLQGGLTEIHYNAVCSRCLQQADFHVKKVLGITYYRKCTLVQGQNILMSPSAIISPIQDCDPNLYKKIFERKCEHYFKKGTFGRTEIFLFSKIYSDGAFAEWASCEERLNGISSVYRLYDFTQDRKQAQNSFRILDALHPAGERQPRAGQILEMYVNEIEQTTNLEGWKRLNQEYFKMLELDN